MSCEIHQTSRHILDHCKRTENFFWAARVQSRFCFIERAMRSQLLSEISRSGRRRWLQVDEMPFSRAITYKLIAAGLISSVVVIWPGSRRGRRLIDGDSLDSYLESLTTKQALAELNAMRPHEMEGARGVSRAYGSVQQSMSHKNSPRSRRYCWQRSTR